MVLALAEGKHAFGIGSPPLKLRFAIQESFSLARFFEQGLSVPKSAAFARMFLARLIDLLDGQGFDSIEYQNLLGHAGFAPLLAAACDPAPEFALANSESPLDAKEFAWVLQPETYLAPGVFAARQRETTGGIRLLDQYARWWLPENPDADIENAWEVPDDAYLRRGAPDHALLESLFLALWAALICCGRDPAADAVLRTIALTTPPATPASDALDLWLHRRAALALFDREGSAPFAAAGEALRPEILRYLAFRRPGVAAFPSPTS